ncbi:MAG: cbb3-type cytochrome c oxidase subunit 3 [Xanthomonadales bacterium]|uniref:cbb3-type cytochrome oxidase subunit 3 n=1 Tax=Dokdonella sp. TaxID=2291710 RepID=UPI002C2D93F0|nr:cbb3-type cytochrome c oxidase subunit 3 [Xanthomonadales bacterium]HQV71835.1 cbb3-type cytochrome c oxidase subunit 3 [Dokdonella sp.]MBK7012729.1 cbb3-type cytochrome c oxidase subunit 3 [Xanthomonadales bacterium]MBK7210421.1 cbb3-type cytochrome c oxidase subunit 3 [Xanthomonadales bacterium]MBL0223875.1 cbb3-type cytochrome c oxidase subunit 3 [Xanthomonadales bacterium]
MISGILTSILMLTFLGLWAWAWSNHRRVDFSEAAHIPLEDDSRPYPEDKP